MNAEAADPFDPPGVTRARAIERAGRVAQIAYTLTLQIPDSPEADIHGRITVSFVLAGTSAPLVFDFAPDRGRLLAAHVDGGRVEAVTANGHITISADTLTAGVMEVAFDFVAGTSPLNRRSDLLYSLFVPARASHVFPCFDQPDLRATWTLTLDVPHGWQAVSNGGESDHRRDASSDTYVFERTVPLPTYLFAFAAGRFVVNTVLQADRAFRVFHAETDAERVARHLPAIVAQHVHAIEWMERYTQVAYPFDKLDIVLIPAMQFGGMEHPGAIFYNAELLLLDENATQQQALSRANVIAHETAHMWFGNLVTMTWFDDVWLKEVFASLMASKIVNPSYPDMNHALRFLAQHYPAAYSVDRTGGAHPIRQPLDNLDDAGTLYGPIIYQKAPIALRHLEFLMGEDALRDGLRDYLSIHAFGNASWTDLVRILSSYTTLNLDAWSGAWIDEPGRPALAITRGVTPPGASALHVHQRDPANLGRLWPQHLQPTVGWGASTRTFAVAMDAPSVAVDGTEKLPAPGWMLPCAGGMAYGTVDLDEDTIAFLTSHVHELDDALTRSSAYLVLWEAMLDGQIAPATIFRTQLNALGSESDELARQLLLDQVRQTFWRYTAARSRPAAAPRLESVLRAGLRRAADAREATSWFAALRAVASTQQTLDWLEGVWRRVQSVGGLALAEADETTLALELAVRWPEHSEAIVATQAARITQDDRRSRLAFIAPFASADATTRSTAFERLADPANRTRETWVVDAMHCLHHPLRAEASLHLVRPALSLVRDIQRTGGIFFPRRWVDAVLSGHQSHAAARDVRSFIDALPGDYPRGLRGILLSAADPLLRASRLLDAWPQ